MKLDDLIPGVSTAKLIGYGLLAAGVVAGLVWLGIAAHTFVKDHDDAIAKVSTLQGQLDNATRANHDLEDQLRQKQADLDFSNGQVKAYQAEAAKRAADYNKLLKDYRHAPGYNDPMPPALAAAYDLVRQSRGQPAIPPKPAPQAGR